MKLKEFNLVMYKTQPAIVSRFEGDKIDIELSGDAKKVREKDVEFLHAGPVRSIKSVLAATLEPGNLAEAADFFRGGTTTFAEIAELVWGSYPAESAFAAWKAVSESPYFSVTTPSAPIAVREIEEAEAIIRKNSAKREEGAEREAFIARLRKTLAASKTGTINGPVDGGIVLPDDAKFLQDVEALALGKTEKSKTLKDASMAETGENAHKVLLAAGYWPLERNPWPARHGKTLSSSPITVDAPDDTDERLDLTHLPAFAIDNAWSADPDDAVSVDGDTLWVHVADPAATVTPDSPADLDARARGATLYVPEGAARMLSEESLAHYALGLGATSRALSFAITFTDSGAIDSVAVKRTRIAVTRLTYAEASARKDEPALAPLFAIAERNVARRRAEGAVFIDLPEVHISLERDADSLAPPRVVIENVESESAADMVREMMLLAGEAVARFAFKNAIPFQYVSQEEPNLPGDLPDGIAGEWRKRRSMRSRKVGTIPADHAGLGLGMYSQVTSPLRRYGDLIAHQQLHLYLDGKPVMKADEMLERVAAGDSAARGCTLAERESNLHWILVHLATHPDWEADAVVVEKNGAQSTILVPSLAQESRVPLGDDVPLNATVRVRAGNVRLPEQTFSLIPV